MYVYVYVRTRMRVRIQTATYMCCATTQRTYVLYDVHRHPIQRMAVYNARLFPDVGGASAKPLAYGQHAQALRCSALEVPSFPGSRRALSGEDVLADLAPTPRPLARPHVCVQGRVGDAMTVTQVSHEARHVVVEHPRHK